MQEALDLFRAALGRDPSAEEQGRIQNLVGSSGDFFGGLGQGAVREPNLVAGAPSAHAAARMEVPPHVQLELVRLRQRNGELEALARAQNMADVVRSMPWGWIVGAGGLVFLICFVYDRRARAA